MKFKTLLTALFLSAAAVASAQSTKDNKEPKKTKAERRAEQDSLEAVAKFKADSLIMVQHMQDSIAMHVKDSTETANLLKADQDYIVAAARTFEKLGMKIIGEADPSVASDDRVYITRKNIDNTLIVYQVNYAPEKGAYDITRLSLPDTLKDDTWQSQQWNKVLQASGDAFTDLGFTSFAGETSETAKGGKQVTCYMIKQGVSSDDMIYRGTFVYELDGTSKVTKIDEMKNPLSILQSRKPDPRWGGKAPVFKK